MNSDELLKIAGQSSLKSNKLIQPDLFGIPGLNIYPRSVTRIEGGIIFLSNIANEKYLFIVNDGKSENNLWDKTTGEEIKIGGEFGPNRIKKCSLTSENATEVQRFLEFARPKVIGLKNSIGMGDRLGIANAGHIRALEGNGFVPILAQQSIRELTRTQRTPQEVMAAAVWAVIQEGYKEGFGADADHLKTTEDIDLLVKAGFTFFTIDPSEHVNNSADVLSESEAEKLIPTVNWNVLGIKYEDLIRNYCSKELVISKDFSINPSKLDLKRALIKYGNAIAHMKNMYDHLAKTYPDYNFELEVSVDETESVTTPFEHFFIANELKRLNVKFVSLAPRFVGDFEKGIDYKGDINLFREEYLKHLAIVNYFGTYKISLHSGSDKFSVYRVIGSLNSGFTHVKTAGTSYLEALKTVAYRDQKLFREILKFSCGLYETEKKSYHVSADLSKVRSADSYSDSELVELFDSNDVRQILHVTFGRVLTDKNEAGQYIFKDRILECLKNNEELHYELLEKHFRKHLEPFQN